MSRATDLLSPLECMQRAWGLILRDFRQWSSPAGQQSIRDWKTRRLEGAILVAKSNMMDDTEAMLKAVQQNNNAKAIGDSDNTGTSVYLPLMITCVSGVESPPDRDLVIDVPSWANVVIPTDPLQRAVQMRTTAVSYRCQIAFFSPDPHAASAIANQFVNFWKHEGKRGIDVDYDVGYAGAKVITDQWKFRVADNTLYPDKIDVGIDNLYGASVDCVIVGTEPTIVGLGGLDDDITDTGEPDGSIPPNLPPVTGNRDPADKLNAFVIEADIIERQADSHTRVAIDADTGVITQTDMKDSAP